MLVWSGKGIYAIIVLVVFLFVCSNIFPTELSDYGFVTALVIAGAFSWVYGFKWNKAPSNNLIGEQSDGRVKAKNGHRLFWIPLQYWGIIFPVIGSIILFQNSVVGGIIATLILAIAVFFQFKDELRIVPVKSKTEMAKIVANNKLISKERPAVSNISFSLPESIQPVRKEVKSMTKAELEEYYKQYMPK